MIPNLFFFCLHSRYLIVSNCSNIAREYIYIYIIYVHIYKHIYIYTWIISDINAIEITVITSKLHTVRFHVPICLGNRWWTTWPQWTSIHSCCAMTMASMARWRWRSFRMAPRWKKLEMFGEDVTWHIYRMLPRDWMLDRLMDRYCSTHIENPSIYPSIYP